MKNFIAVFLCGMLAAVSRSAGYYLATGTRRIRSGSRELLVYGNRTHLGENLRICVCMYSSMADNPENGQEAAGADPSQPKTAKQLKKEAKKNAKLAKFNEKMTRVQTQPATQDVCMQGVVLIGYN